MSPSNDSATAMGNSNSSATIPAAVNTTTSTSTNGTKDAKDFTLCVFCGANPGADSVFVDAATELATIMSQNKWRLVYGGGTVGLMGQLSRTLVSLGGPGSVHGIILKALIKFEQDGNVPPESEYGKTTVVNTMHERKSMMAREAHAFVALPGGYGTMEELFEVVTWNQLGIHDCPIIIYNVGGFYDGLLEWIQKAVTSGFVKPGAANIISEAKTAAEVMEKVRSYQVSTDRYNLQWESEG